MMIKETKKPLIGISAIIIIVMLSFVYIPVCEAAYNSLEIINIKPAGTGSPAINSNHRIFRAYPGIKYNIRPAVIGGMYPYRFSLSNAPTGMTIDANTGIIQWLNPQISASSIRLTVTDAESNTATTTWSINVTTNGFIFVDASYTGTKTGSITQPYNSIEDIFNLNGHESDIVYFRSGTYSIPVYQPIYYLNIGCTLSYNNGKPHIWLSYPDENVTINMNQHYFEAANLATPYYFEGLRFYNAYEYGFRISSSCNYATFYRCDFDTLRTGRAAENHNQGYYFTIAEGIGNYLVFQNCSFHDYTDTAGLGSFYYQNKMLIEDCHFYNQYQQSGYICTSIAAKTAVMNSTFRHNIANISNGTVLGTGVNGMFTNGGGTSINNEVCFNYFKHSGGGEDHRFNNNGNQGSLYYYRNTNVGTIMMRYINASGYTNGPFMFNGNVIINSVSGLTYHYTCGPNPEQYVTFTNNLTGTSSSNIVDTNGHLTSNYSSYVGTRGWQTVAEAITPPPADTTPPQAPSGVTTTIISN